nr:hypothetical protein [uncultured Noviherbaspirillum sp.]
MRNLRLKLGVIVLINASLLGCGGGGGNDGGTTASGSAGVAGSGASYSAITQANYETVAATVLDPVGELTDLNSATGLITSGVELDAPPLSLATASNQIYRRFSGKGAQFVSGAVYTEACSRGGSVTVNESVASDSKLTPGDRLTISANNCAEDDLPSLNGTLSITINAVSGDPINSNRYSLEMTTTFGNLAMSSGARRVLIDGDLKISASQSGSSDTGIGLSGSRLSLSIDQSGTTTDAYTLADFSLAGSETASSTSLAGAYTLSGNSAKLGAYSYRVQTVRPIVMSSSGSFISAGALLITGTPATVTVTSLDGTTLRLDYSAKGDGIVTANSTLTRAQFDALN